LRSKGPAPHTNGTTGTPAVSPNGASHVAVNGHAVIERPRARPSAQEVKAKKKAIARKYKQRRLQRDPDCINKTMLMAQQAPHHIVGPGAPLNMGGNMG
jgi:hypothetical protein